MRTALTAFFVVFFTVLKGVSKGMAFIATQGIKLISDKHQQSGANSVVKGSPAPMATTLPTKAVLVSPALTEEKKTPDPLVLRTAMESIDQAKLNATSAVMVSDRNIILPLVSQNKHPFGKAWIYLYKEAKIARRLLVIQDPQLARVICGPGEHRWFFKDVEFLAERGTEAIVADLMKEIQLLLRKKRVVDQRVQTERQAQPAPEVIPVQQRPAEPVKAAAPAPKVPAMPQEAGEPKAPRQPLNRSVNGHEFTGTVVEMGRTTKRGPRGAYETYCLTLNNGSRELPFNGAEVERLCRDLGIRVGERIKVVDMGKMDVVVPGVEKPRQKNLYQITRMGVN